MNRNKEAILDLIRAIKLIIEFSKNLDYPSFYEDIKTQSSILYQIVIMGEAINQLSSEFIQSYPEIPFNAIRGMRNRVVHEYKEVDVKILWEVIQTNIPELLVKIEMIDNDKNW